MSKDCKGELNGANNDVGEGTIQVVRKACIS